MSRKAMAALARLARKDIVVGIRREDPTRLWERRCPLTPDAVHSLAKDGVTVHVEHCDRRIFPDRELVKAGAKIVPDLRAAQIILGIKEPPLKELQLSLRDGVRRTYMMFSHTAKGQQYNMPLLSSFLSSPTAPRLVDIELLTDDAGKRTVGFGWFAGFAGVFESLAAMAQTHLYKGIASPFLYTPRPHTQPSMDHLRASLRDIGARITAFGTPETLGPFVIGVTGTGNVAQGCLAALAELPLEHVAVKDLPALVNDKNTDLRKIYLVHAKSSDYLSTATGTYNRDDYYANPDAYASNFAQTIAPYLTLFLNGAGWAPGYPRLMNKAHLPEALTRAKDLPGGPFRFTNIGDISCDPEGGLEFMTHSTTLSAPSFTLCPSESPALPDVSIMSVDILPTAIPLDASNKFSEALLPYLRAVVAGYAGDRLYSTDDDPEVGRALARATIAEKGALTEKHVWLGELIQSLGVGANGGGEKSVDVKVKDANVKRVLILGSGMVAGPAVDWIAQRKDIRVTIASNSVKELEALSAAHENVEYLQADLSDMGNVVDVLKDVDVVISLLPVSLHVKVAELCIEHKKHLVTASYISDEMKALHSRAQAANVTLLNEIGLDPGIDHLSAISMIEALKAQRKRITAFASFCGGLPDFALRRKGMTTHDDDKASWHPLGYKFSWSPRGGVAAFGNGARYLMGGEERVVGEGGMGREGYFPGVPVNLDLGEDGKEREAGGELEGYPNRDSLKYIDEYGLERGTLRTFVRGTLRFKGFSEVMEAARKHGLLDNAPVASWADVPDAFFSGLTELGFGLNATRPTPGEVENGIKSKLDYFVKVLTEDPALWYGEGEHDMVLLSHEITTTTSSSSTSTAVEGEEEEEEVHTAVLYMVGDAKYSAMAKTVGLPVAMAALLVLDGGVGMRGVMGPGHESVRVPLLKGLEDAGIVMRERTVRGGELGEMRRAGRVSRGGVILTRGEVVG